MQSEGLLDDVAELAGIFDIRGALREQDLPAEPHGVKGASAPFTPPEATSDGEGQTPPTLGISSREDHHHRLTKRPRCRDRLQGARSYDAGKKVSKGT